jgi:uncharacterized protein (DUF1697 family)
MMTFIALLRGVNVGKAKRVPMAELRSLLAGLGYTDVATLLNSGNAVFRASTPDAEKHAADIAAAIAAQLKIEVPVIVKSAPAWAALIADNPIPAEPEAHSRFLVAVAQDAKRLTDLASVEALVVAPERFALGKHAAYLFCATGILESKAGEALVAKAGRLLTTRNWATVLKLQALADQRRA